MPKPKYIYEQPERFGESLTTSRPWNRHALTGVEQLNGRMAMVGFTAAVLGEWLTGEGILGQLSGVVGWYLSFG